MSFLFVWFPSAYTCTPHTNGSNVHRKRKGEREGEKEERLGRGRKGGEKAKRIMNNLCDSCSLECTLALEDYSLNIWLFWLCVLDFRNAYEKLVEADFKIKVLLLPAKYVFDIARETHLNLIYFNWVFIPYLAQIHLLIGPIITWMHVLNWHE